MNVLFLTHRLPYAPNRGDRIRAHHMLREMSRFADVSLFSLVHDADEAAHARSVPFAKTVSTARVSRMAKLARAPAWLLSNRPLTHLLLDAPEVTRRLSELVEASPPDVVLAYCSGMARFALEPPLDRLPFVLDMVDVDSAKWADLANETRGWRRWIYRREAATLSAFEAEVTALAATTLVVTERERDTLRAITADGRIRVVEVGVDLEAFRPPASNIRSPTVVFCGVLNYHPNEAGVLWFLEAVWPRIHAARPEARFTIVGANPTPALRRAAIRHASVDLVGTVPVVQPYLWNAAVSVAPLRVARGSQTKVLEALAAGLPVVATPVVLAGLQQQAHKGCLAALSAGDFANAVLALLDETSQGVSRAAAVDVNTLGWPQRLGDLEGILSEAAR